MQSVMRRVIRTDGSELVLDSAKTINEIAELIDAQVLDTVTLPRGLVMAVDDLGHKKNLPINYSATALYHSVCRAGVEWQIRGDVVVVPDADFAGAV